MPRTVVTDADMLFGGTTRALFIFLGYANVLHVHWSQRILTELSEALVMEGRKPDKAAAIAHEQLMNASLKDALVDQALVDRHEAAMMAYVNDAGDAHVAACAYELVTGDTTQPTKRLCFQRVTWTTSRLQSWQPSESQSNIRTPS